MSPYVYAENNPVLKNDPTGLLTQAQFDDIVEELLKDDGGEGDIWYPDENGGGGRYDWRDQPTKWMIEYLNNNNGWQYTMLDGRGSGFSSNVFDFKGETYFAGVEFVDGKAMSMVVNSLEIVEPGAYMKVGEYYFWEAGQEQNGGYRDPDWLNASQAGLAVGEAARQGMVYNIFGRSAQNVDNAIKNGQFIHTNGKLYSQGFKGNQHIAANAVKNSLSTGSFARNLGRGMTGVGAGLAIVQFGMSDQSGADIARLTGSFIITGSAFIPIVGPAISIGLGIADSLGAFDGVYGYFD